MADLRENLIKETEMKISKSLKRDIFIIQMINSIDELNKIFNISMNRLREWLGYMFPEFVRKSSDDALMNIDESIRENNEPMGIKYNDNDLREIIEFASMIRSIHNERENILKGLDKIMDEMCRNLKDLAGTTIGARLIALAGGFESLAKSPASKIQLLGAEKALFRHLKTGAKSPKHGIIHEHPFVMKAKEKGKASRALADKLSIAVKVDYFKGEYIADKLISELENRFGK